MDQHNVIRGIINDSSDFLSRCNEYFRWLEIGETRFVGSDSKRLLAHDVKHTTVLNLLEFFFFFLFFSVSLSLSLSRSVHVRMNLTGLKSHRIHIYSICSQWNRANKKENQSKRPKLHEAKTQNSFFFRLLLFANRNTFLHSYPITTHLIRNLNMSSQNKILVHENINTNKSKEIFGQPFFCAEFVVEATEICDIFADFQRYE